MNCSDSIKQTALESTPNHTSKEGIGLDAGLRGDANAQLVDSDLAHTGGLEVPSYVIHPADLPLISQVATSMHLSVIDYVQLAPHLYASLHRRRNNIVSANNTDLSDVSQQLR